MLLTVLLLLPFAVSAQAVQFDSIMDWTNGEITTYATVDISTMDSPLPAIRKKAMENADSGLVDHIITFIKDISVTAGASIGDLISQDTRLLAEAYEFSKTFIVTRSHVSADLRSLNIQYLHRVYPDLASLFVTHARITEHEPFLGHSPSTAFTGLVIHAKDFLPVHGENGDLSRVTQAIRPRIYDENMRLLYDPSMAERLVVQRSGSVGYDSQLNLPRNRERIGDFPLVTVARGVFGSNCTDLIIPANIADRILALPENRTLLREARILIICELDSMKESTSPQQAAGYVGSGRN